MITARSTKAEPVAHIRELDAELTTMAGNLQVCRMQLSMAKSAPVLPLGKHAAYYDYVRECKVAQRGQRVCTYKTYAQWSAA